MELTQYVQTSDPSQSALMSHLYASLESSRLSILESPTGTGKSLTLLIGSLVWLSHHAERSVRAKVCSVENEDEPEWVQKHYIEHKIKELKASEIELECRLDEVRKRREDDRKRRELESARIGTKRRIGGVVEKEKKRKKLEKDDVEEFLLQDWEESGSMKKTIIGEDGLTDEVREMMKR
jgi:chromosome transmission fidelity protein 1